MGTGNKTPSEPTVDALAIHQAPLEDTRHSSPVPFEPSVHPDDQSTFEPWPGFPSLSSMHPDSSSPPTPIPKEDAALGERERVVREREDALTAPASNAATALQLANPQDQWSRVATIFRRMDSVRCRKLVLYPYLRPGLNKVLVEFNSSQSFKNPQKRHPRLPGGGGEGENFWAGSI